MYVHACVKQGKIAFEMYHTVWTKYGPDVATLLVNTDNAFLKGAL